MFLIEPERGCHRGCTYCVMRRSTNGGMRLVAPDKVQVADPGRRAARRPGGRRGHRPPAACPRSCAHIVDGGREVGISSLRADRLNDEIVGLLKRGGYRTLTTAADGASERDARAHPAQDQGAPPDARRPSFAATHGMKQLKLYMMLGLPGETMADIDELARFALELARDRAARGARHRAVRRQAQHAARRRRRSRRSTSRRQAGAPARGGAGRVEAAPDLARSGRGSSTGWPRAASRPGRAAAGAARAGGRFADWKAALAEVPAPAVAKRLPARRSVRRSRSRRSRPGRPWAGRRPERSRARAAVAEVARVDLVDGAEVLEIGEEDRRLHDRRERRARRRQHRAQVLEHAFRLAPHVARADHLAGLRIERDLPEQNTRWPAGATTACAYGPIALGAFSRASSFFAWTGSNST